MSEQQLKRILRRKIEGYRRIAFPVGGAVIIRTRDQQNHALVARGGYAACQRLLEELFPQRVTPSTEHHDRRMAESESGACNPE